MISVLFDILFLDCPKRQISKKCFIVIFNYSSFIKEVKTVLAQNKPESVKLCEEGVGGTYFIEEESGEILAVFKPTDEEPGAINNPKQILSHPLLPPGGGSIRELAAYLLDRGYAGVPETVIVGNIEHRFFSKDGICIPKSGSLQRFIDNMGNASEMGSSLFSIDNIHRIGILDIRLFNMDRNCENLLVQKSPISNTYSLIPIDHTYILPPTFDFVWFEWLYWKQAKLPFSSSNLSYISSLDIYYDAQILNGLGFNSGVIRVMMISTTLLQIGAKIGLSLFDIASMISRAKPNQLSQLEEIVLLTEKVISQKNPEWKIEEMDIFLEELTKIITKELEEQFQKKDNLKLSR